MDPYQDHIGANGRPDLGLYGVDTVPIKGFYSKILLDPLKKQLNLPALLVIRGNLFGSSRFYVGKYDNILIILFIDHVYPAQDLRIFCFGFGRDQANRLVAFQTLLGSNGNGILAIKFQVFLSPDDEFPTLTVNFEQSFEVYLSPVHDVDSPGLNRYVIQDIHIVHPPVGNVNKYGYIFLQVHDNMHLNSSFTMMELCPGEQRQTQIDGVGIQGKNLFRFFQSNLIIAVQVASMFYENQRQILIHLPRPVAIGIGKCAQRDLRSLSSSMVRLPVAARLQRWEMRISISISLGVIIIGNV